MEEAEGKPLLLIEIVDDPTDKRMPHKLRLNAQAVAALAGSEDRFVRPGSPGRPRHRLRTLPLGQKLPAEPADPET